MSYEHMTQWQEIMKEKKSDPLYRISNAANKTLDGCLERPGMYAGSKGELVAVVWTTMAMESAAHGCPEIVRESRAKIFHGSQRISIRYPGMKLTSFTEVLRPWIEEYRNMLAERNAIAS
jgi:hypothetical protein